MKPVVPLSIQACAVRRSLPRVRAAALLAAALTAPGVSFAQLPEVAPPPADGAAIGGSAGAHAAGRVAVNQAAGAGNVQANVALLASQAGTVVLQQQAAGRAGDAAASSVIAGQAFSGAHGIVSINQASGSSNVQFNAASLGPLSRVQVVSDRMLGRAAPRGEPGPGLLTSHVAYQAVIARSALAGDVGVVQVNQTAGVGNFTGNSIALQLPSAH